MIIKIYYTYQSRDHNQWCSITYQRTEKWKQTHIHVNQENIISGILLHINQENIIRIFVNINIV